MKKQDWALVAATAAYSFLFYQQNSGLNFLLFSVTVTALLAWYNPSGMRDPAWATPAVLTLATGLFVFVHSSWLAIIANVLSLLSLAGASMNRQSSVAMNLLAAGGSVAASPAFLAEDIYNKTQQDNPGEKKYLRSLLVYLVPLALAVLFFAIYRAANPLFAEFTKKINLDFITFRWIMFTLAGLLVCSGLVRSRRFAAIDLWEKRQQPAIDVSKNPGWNEKKAATILFVLLNLMLLFMNFLDVNYLYLGAGMPDGITHKQFVHKGVGNLILSIVMGISVILFFFRGHLNSGENKLLKWLVYLWIIQNLMMVISTCVRNDIYIQEALITYKRIGVYFWTGMAAAGLLTTAWKIRHRLQAWFLIRSNSMIALVVLAAASAVDWDRFVTGYNLRRIGHLKDLDKRYLISLSESNFKELFELSYKEGFENNIYYHYEFSKSYGNADKLRERLGWYLESRRGTDWRSVSLRQQRVMDDLRNLDRRGLIGTLDLRPIATKDLAPFVMLENIKVLQLPEKMRITDEVVEQIGSFRNLERLEMATLPYTDLISFVRLKQVPQVKIGALDATALAFLRREMPQTSITVDHLQNAGQPTASR